MSGYGGVSSRAIRTKAEFTDVLSKVDGAIVKEVIVLKTKVKRFNY